MRRHTIQAVRLCQPWPTRRRARRALRRIRRNRRTNRMPASATDFSIPFLRGRRTNKWHKFADAVLPAWVADMDFGVAPPIAEALARLARTQEYGYAAREGLLAEAFARRMQSRFDWTVDPADAHPIGDLVQATF